MFWSCWTATLPARAAFTACRPVAGPLVCCAKAGELATSTIASIAANNINFLNFFLLNSRRGSHSRPILLFLFPEVDHLHQCQISQISCWYLPLETPSF